MKNVLKIFILASAIFISFVACEKYKDDRFDFSNKVNAYVLLSDNNSIQSYEGYDSINLTLELPISVAEDVIVTYQISGNAVFNQDYFMYNTEETTIEFDVFTTNTDKGVITIYPLDDIYVDGDKTLVIKLVSAYTDSSNRYLDIGLNNVGATFTVFLDDDDCPSSLAGEYESYSIWDSDTSYKDVTISFSDTNQYIVTDISAGALDYLSPPNVPIQATLKYACGDIVSHNIINEHDILSFIDINGLETQQDTSFYLEWTFVDDLGNVYNSATTYFTRK